MAWEYKPKTDKQLSDWYKAKVREGISGFNSYEDFRNWYDTKDKHCYYCGLTERESQQIVHDGILTSNRFPFQGLIKQGVNRAYWLETDRKNPKGIYSRENCVLTCYFCNNDKSDVFTEEQYIAFKENRVHFLRSLLQE